MVGLLGVLKVLFLVALNSGLTALMTRFFRVRLSTSWGSLLYALALCPLAMLAVVYVADLLPPDASLGNPTAALLVTVVVPLSIGIPFDYFWMPAPEDVELPETTT